MDGVVVLTSRIHILTSYPVDRVIRALSRGKRGGGAVDARSYLSTTNCRQQIPNKVIHLFLTGNLSDKLTLSNANILIVF